MLYHAIDQHRKQLTVNLRNEAGDVILGADARQLLVQRRQHRSIEHGKQQTGVAATGNWKSAGRTDNEDLRH